MYTINQTKKQHQLFNVFNIEGNRVQIHPLIQADIGGRTRVLLDQVGEFVVNHTEAEVLRLHYASFSKRFVDPDVYKKWNRRHGLCKVCSNKRKLSREINSIPDDLNIDRLFNDNWRDTEYCVSPYTRKVMDSLFYMELMDLKNISLADPVEVQVAISQLQEALETATKAITGENNIWTYHRKVLIDFIGEHEREVTTWADKTAYYHKKAMSLFDQNQYLKKKVICLQHQLARATRNYNITEPDIAFRLCPRPLSCEGNGICCSNKAVKNLEIGCVICPYPACLKCLDIRHRH